MHEILRVAAVQATKGPPSFSDLPYRYPSPQPAGVASMVDTSSLKVDVIGIFSPHDSASRTRKLSALILDRTHRLQHFQHSLLESLLKADFLASAQHPNIHVMMTVLSSNWGWEKDLYDPSTRRWISDPERPKSPEVDASELIHRWKDYDWATNVQLEKLCVYARGAIEKIPGGGGRLKQMREVDSIMLP